MSFTAFTFLVIVVAFAGDALICVFPEEQRSTGTSQDAGDVTDGKSDVDSSGRVGANTTPTFGFVNSYDSYDSGEISCKNNSEEQAAKNSCFRALTCANRLRFHQTQYLSTHIGVSYGAMKMALLGGHQGQWVFLMNGTCVSELSTCIDDAGPQEVVATAVCFERALQVYSALTPPLTARHIDGDQADGGPSRFQQQHSHSGYVTGRAALPGGLSRRALTNPNPGIKSVSPAQPKPNTAVAVTTSNITSVITSSAVPTPVLRRYTVSNKEEREGEAKAKEEEQHVVAMEFLAQQTQQQQHASFAHTSNVDTLPHSPQQLEVNSVVLDAPPLSLFQPKQPQTQQQQPQQQPPPSPQQQQMPSPLKLNNRSSLYSQAFIKHHYPESGSTNVHIDFMEPLTAVRAGFADSSPNVLGRIGFIRKLSSLLSISSKSHNFVSVGDGSTKVHKSTQSVPTPAPSTAAIGKLQSQRSQQIEKFKSIGAGKKAKKHFHCGSASDKEVGNDILVGDNVDDEEVAAAQQSQQALLHNVAMFVPVPVLAALRYDTFDNLGELRNVTTMFLSLDSYSSDAHSDPTTLQPFFLLGQQALHMTGGFLRQFLVDDKGCVFIAMWGVPSFTYANNCSRALNCAVSIHRSASQQLDFRCSIGIATGNVFCGTVGATERCDYAGIGTDVNIAARLMGKARGRILVDHRTHGNLNAEAQAMLQSAEAMQLKGIDGPMTPFCFASESIPPLASIDEGLVGSGKSKLLKRNVMALLDNQLDKISNNFAHTMHRIRSFSPMKSPQQARAFTNPIFELNRPSSSKFTTPRSTTPRRQQAPISGQSTSPCTPTPLAIGAVSETRTAAEAPSIVVDQCDAKKSDMAVGAEPSSLKRSSWRWVDPPPSSSLRPGSISRTRGVNFINALTPRQLQLQRALSSVSFTVLQGAPGTSKSTAAEYFRIEARKRGIHVVHVKAQSSHRMEPYGVMRDLFFDLIGRPRTHFNQTVADNDPHHHSYRSINSSGRGGRASSRGDSAGNDSKKGGGEEKSWQAQVGTLKHHEKNNTFYPTRNKLSSQPNSYYFYPPFIFF